MITMQLIPVKPDVPARLWRQWMSEALQKGLIFWHRKFLRFHFTMSAYTRYPGVYKRRKIHTWKSFLGNQPGQGEKTFWVKDNRPLYETGQTRQLALARVRTSGAAAGAGTLFGKALRALGAPTGTDVVWAQAKFYVPSYLKFIEQWGYKPHEELTAINASEMRQIARVVNYYLQSKINERKGVAGVGLSRTYPAPVVRAYLPAAG